MTYYVIVFLNENNERNFSQHIITKEEFYGMYGKTTEIICSIRLAKWSHLYGKS